MKSGAGSPFDEDDFAEEDEGESVETTESEPELSSSEETTATDREETTSDLPYKYRRDGVQDGRSHGNIFLCDEAEEHVEELVDRMDDVFDNEAVYKIDVLEAAVLAVDEPDRTLEDELRKMGYGMK
ncbi:hypothetical protein [Haloarcula nitratireducens]|uniref:Uncharacterized protein n=1 Tax=Haloarcula nitratireducens TaxID=2487749 RepID=A0AAW4PGY2_9EURY|nr:hypothetical protein [Halomicroarcula nitratireducens]MBX0297711.1 hypothetical protein [Halomicroarcula nitratireducens]